jgi:uncharacterized protein
LRVEIDNSIKTNTYETTDDGVTVMSESMTSDLEISGPVAAKLWLSSDTSDAGVFVALRVFDPAGKEAVFVGSNEPRTPVGYRIGFFVPGKDDEYDGTDAGVAHAPDPMKGIGPFTHTLARPAAIFGGRNTLHFAEGKCRVSSCW